MRIEQVRTEEARNQQPGDLLDREIELIRRIMLKVSQRKTSAKKRSSSKMKTKTNCESVASEARQHKIWRPREKQHTTAQIDDNLQNKVWDLGGQRLKTHDQEIMIVSTLGV